LYWIATGLLAFFAVAHTVGGVVAVDSNGPAADGVLALMRSVHFVVFGADRTYYELYLGFGLMVSVGLAFFAFAASMLARAQGAQRTTLQPLAWALLVAQVANLALSWRYFFTPPVITSALLVILIGVASARDASREAP
jgi:hypothetical protein